eukprot:CAMPEP_0198117266 /NCGR_PEP_ID=MMETSP1442-20131203/17503_1 /TAXON_ID= /ORGANISM="Craspedostauros australis, Strain CCMP3328" /LENGTH=209 /DNA_ID=CAMNT_0043775287 /DNA_START=1 /DNA_END=630 /DNA_ORIENTATION=-
MSNVRQRSKHPQPVDVTLNNPDNSTDNGTNDDAHADFLDETEQDELVRSLEAEALQQTKLFQSAYRYISAFAVLVSLSYPLLCADECSAAWVSCWLHATVSAVLHIVTMVGITKHEDIMLCCVSDASQQMNKTSTSWLYVPTIATVATALLLLVWYAGYFGSDKDHFHIGLTIGNGVTVLAGRMLQWDARTTIGSLKDLNAAKYHHKSL